MTDVRLAFPSSVLGISRVSRQSSFEIGPEIELCDEAVASVIEWLLIIPFTLYPLYSFYLQLLGVGARLLIACAFTGSVQVASGSQERELPWTLLLLLVLFSEAAVALTTFSH